MAGDLGFFTVFQANCQVFINATIEAQDRMLRTDNRMAKLIEAEKELFKKTLIKPRDAKFLRKYRKQGYQPFQHPHDEE